MKALFITTETVDTLNHVRAWESAFSPAEHHQFNHRGLRNDWQFTEIARQVKPDIIFYIGAVEGKGNPKIETLQELRTIAPVVNLCSDAMDLPWHKTLRHYNNLGCFDLQVSLDGAKDAPVDLATLTPVASHRFNPNEEKTIRCGFSGTVGRWCNRAEIIHALEWFGGLTVRERSTSYIDHAKFMSKCQMILNTSWTGTGNNHHIKGRVLEAGFAGCALLEHEDSPIAEWFPKGSWIPWRHPRDIAEIIAEEDSQVIESAAKMLSDKVKHSYTAKQIYSEIINHVDIANEKQAAQH